MNLSMKQKRTQRHREETCGCCGGRERLGVWDQQMQTSIYRMGKQQGNYIQYPATNCNGKAYEREKNIQVCITESLCCTPETNTTL